MVMTRQVCNWCGEEFEDQFNSAMHFDHRFGYGSKLDGEELSFTLCPCCADKLAALLKVMFTYAPIDDFS